MSQFSADDAARAVRRALDLTRAEAFLLQLMLEAGPDNPTPRDAFAKAESKSGDVILCRLRAKLKERDIAIITIFPSGAAVDGRAALKFRAKANGYALNQDGTDAIMQIAAEAGVIPSTSIARVA